MPASFLVLAAAMAAADLGPRPAAPRINAGGIVNAASNRPAPDNYVSPGAIVSIYGAGLAAEAREVRTSDLDSGFLPEILAGVSVFFGPVAAHLFYVSPLQINAQVPTALQSGVWEVIVRFDRLESREKVMVRPYSAGLFGSFRHNDGVLVNRDAPARPGEYILFFGTGFGPTRPPIVAGALAPPGPTWMVNPIEAKIGEFSLGPEDIYYWGLAPGFAGLYQFNLRIPASAPSGELEVLVRVADEWTQPGVKVLVQR